jgi:nucleotide-binding universal stress UspA family protein
MRTILMLTDLSPKAEHVAVQALHIAAAVKCDVLLSNTYAINEEYLSEDDACWPVETFRRTQADIGQRMQKLFEKLTEKADQIELYRPHIYVHHQFGEFGSNLGVLTAMFNPFLIIMGARHNEHRSPSRAESEAWIALSHAGLPILFIPETWHFNGIKHITLSSDLNCISEGNQDFIVMLADLFKAKLALVHVTTQEAAPRSTSQLEQLATQIPATVNETRLLIDNDLGMALRAYIRLTDTNLLIMVHRHDKHHGPIWHQSHSAGMLDHLNIPLLILHQ